MDGTVVSYLVDTFNAAVEFGRRRIGKARYEHSRLARFLFCASVISNITWFLWKLRSRIQYAMTGWCGNGCDHVEPYGFVPEAECPIHDRYSSDRRKRTMADLLKYTSCVLLYEGNMGRHER